MAARMAPDRPASRPGDLLEIECLAVGTVEFQHPY